MTAPPPGPPDPQQDDSGVLTQILHALDALDQRVAALETRTADRARETAEAGEAGEADGAPSAVLAAWVHWLRETYRMHRGIPATWQHDPALVAELQALYWAYKAAYQGVSDRDGSAQPLAWHEALARARARLEDHVARARPEPDLAAWVHWLRHAYQLTDTIPDDWAEHPAIAEELRGLHGAYQAGQHADPASFTRLSWLDALARVLQRLPAWQQHAERRARLAPDPPPGGDGQAHNSSS